jgi:hypothetical protein
MRTLVLVVAAACGGSDRNFTDGPGALVTSIDCNRLGPDGTGFMFDIEYGVTLDVGQTFSGELRFPTSAPPVNRSDIYNCGAWSNAGSSGVDQGCQRDAGQMTVSQRVFHNVAIEFPDPLPPPVTVMVIATTTMGISDSDSVTCP